MTNAVVVFVADFGLASAVAARAVDSGFALIDAEPAVAVVSGPDPIFAALAPAAAGLVSAFVLAAFHADHGFVLFARPAVLAAHRPLC